jgi:hypothetical protein
MQGGRGITLLILNLGAGWRLKYKRVHYTAYLFDVGSKLQKKFSMIKVIFYLHIK